MSIAEIPNVTELTVGESGSDNDTTAAICQEIQQLYRQRRAAMKLRIMLENGTAAFVAGCIGYSTGDDEKERKKSFAQAQKLVKEIDSGDKSDVTDPPFAAIVRVSYPSRTGFEDYETRLTAKMVELAEQLPVAEWFAHPDRRGIKLTMLATIIGETGDLSNYANPAKLWRRLFGAPFEKGGKVKMPSSWRRGGGLSADDWEDIGYSPRRNAATYQLRENIVMQNREGPYRARYDEAKERAKVAHPDWTPGHIHAHAQLLSAKRFIRDLWNEWNGMPAPTEPPQ